MGLKAKRKTHAIGDAALAYTLCRRDFFRKRIEISYVAADVTCKTCLRKLKEREGNHG